MKSIATAIAIAVLLTVTTVFAQTATQPNEPESQQAQMLAEGRITTIDLAEGTVTLDNGMQFTLAPSLQYTSFPVLGQDVLVTYEEHGGTNVARIIDVGGTHNGGGD